MSAPVTAGNVALVLDRHPNLTPSGFACARCHPGGWVNHQTCDGCGDPAALLVDAAVRRVGAVTALLESLPVAARTRGFNGRADAARLATALGRRLAEPVSPGEVVAGFLLAGFRVRADGERAFFNASQRVLAAELPGLDPRADRPRARSWSGWRD